MSILIPCSGFVIHFNCEQWLSSSFSCFRHLQTEIRTSPSPFQWYLGFCRLKQVNIAYLNWSLGNWGKVCVGGGGVVLCFGTFPVLYSFGIFHCFCTSVPYKRRKLSPWSPPGSTKGLRNACNSNTQPNNQKEHSNHAFALKTWDMCNVYCIFKKKKSPLTSDITGGAAIWWKKKLGHVPHHNLLPSLPVLLMLLFYFLSLFVHVDSLDLHECLAVHTDPAHNLN